MINRNRGKEAYNIPYVMNIRVIEFISTSIVSFRGQPY